jgi:enterochelin esterase-like enzyme
MLLSAQVPKVSVGTIQQFKHFPSKFVASRNIDVWLPEGYSPQKKYAVLYMNDGKSLFDSNIVWNHQEWGVDEVLGKLMSEKKIRECIVVGVYNGESLRHLEYFPKKPFDLLSKAQRQKIFASVRPGGQPLFKDDTLRSDLYLRFLVEELKPFIDHTFPTLQNRENTFVAGSSMGGLISWYALCEYPNVFGGAACLSTHWPGVFSTDNNPVPGAFMKYLSAKLPSPKTHRIYFDYGSATLDSMYKPYQQQVDRVMMRRKYDQFSWVSREFVGSDHSENSWRKRLDIPILFLLK